MLTVVVAVIGWLMTGTVATGQSTAGPSAFCHVTDGQFTECPGGGREWSDVPVMVFPETRAYLYASQADLDPTKGNPLDTFVLMYDECGRRTPLGPDEYFRVAFKTVEIEDGIEKLEHYVIHVFTDGTIVFIEDGVIQPPGRAPVVDGMRGKVGFGPSPNCPFDHVIAEFEVPLSITGSSYSPDPLFWGASAPPPPPPPECQPGQLEVPVLVNVLSGVTGGAAATNAEIEAVVRQASDILGQGGMCLTVSLIDRDTSDLGNGDGMIDQAELSALIDACVEELGSRFGRDIGYKITFANGFAFNDTTEGVAPGSPPDGDSVPLPPIFTSPTMGLRGYPCVFLKANVADAGYNLAHEIGHTAGLGHRDDPNNLMDKTTGGGAELSESQRFAITVAAVRRRANTEHAAWTDPVGDVSDAHTDLRLGSLFALTLASDLEIAMGLAGSFPAGLAVNVKVEVLFDTDDNPATGTTVGSRPGTDKILEIVLAGQFPFTGPDGTMTSTLVDVASATGSPLAPGVVDRVQLILDFNDATLDFGDVIRQVVPFPLLGASAARIPMTIRTTDLDSGEVDEAALVFTLSLTPGLRAIRPGFDAASIPANDDASTGLLPLGFSLNFFGSSFNGVFVNNNGNVTLDAPLSTFTPFGLTSTGRVIIAPFFADVDTRVGNLVTYGPGTVDGRPAFAATWPGVGCFNRNATVLNFFQVVLIDRSDLAPGDFDIEFNYDSIQWEAGQASGGDAGCLGGVAARAGFSNGTGQPGTSFELPGSGIPGAFLDTNTATGLIHGSLNAERTGRYVLHVRNGVTAVQRDRDADGVRDDLDNCPTVANADQRDSNLNGIGDACETPDLLNSTAGFMQANFDGTTLVEAWPLPVNQEPSLLEQLVRIVAFRLAAGLSTSAETTTANLVASLVDLNLVAPQDASTLIEAVLEQVVVAAPCPRSHGFWKNHLGWPTASLVLGAQSYDQLELLVLLTAPVGSRGGADASLILAHQLIAAKLNVAAGADPGPASSIIDQADGVLGGLSGTLPYAVAPSSPSGKSMTATATLLESYNTAHLTPLCVP